MADEPPATANAASTLSLLVEAAALQVIFVPCVPCSDLELQRMTHLCLSNTFACCLFRAHFCLQVAVGAHDGGSEATAVGALDLEYEQSRRNSNRTAEGRLRRQFSRDLSCCMLCTV